jgi:dTDP-4-amino-4,6-dideoxygalactose transaminase
MRIPLSSPDITEAEIEAVVAVLRSPRLSLGPVAEQFEAAMAGAASAEHAIAVSSGTAGLHLCIRAMDIGEGDEVIVPSFTFIAAANAIRYERATPVFVDIDPGTLNIDPQKIEEAITGKTRAILVVHTFGVPAEMNAILEIARRRGLIVIEDACEAIGAEYHGREAGSMGRAGVFAFYPNKQITTGEGGVVVTHDDALARRIRALRNQGRYESDDWLQHSELGYNYRISDINCALGLTQLSRLEQILQARERVASAYHQRLAQNEGLLLPMRAVAGGRISWFVYVVRLVAADRDRVMRGLAAAGIASGRYFAPIHQQPSYAAWRHSARLPVTEVEAARTLALPFFNRLSEAEIEHVCTTLGRLLLERS